MPSPPAPPPRPAATRAEPESNVPLPPGAVARYGSEHFRTPYGIDSTALSPDGKLFAVGGNPVRVYEAATWKPVRQLAAGGDDLAIGARHLVFSPDGRYLAGSNTRFAYLWDVGNWKLLHRIDGEELWRWTQFCAFTADNLLAISDKEKLLFFDPTTGREVRSVPAGRTVALSPDGRVFVRTRGGDPRNLTFGDATTGKELFALDGLVEWSHSRKGLAFAPDGKSFALLRTGRNEVEVWDTAKQARRQTLRTTATLGSSWLGEHDVGFTSDGKTIFAREKFGDMIRWDVGTGKELPRLRAGSGPPLGGLHAPPDGKTLLTTSIHGWVRVWDAPPASGTPRGGERMRAASADREERPVPGRYWEAVLALAPDGKSVAVGDRSGRLDLLDATTGKLVRTLRETGTPMRKLVFSPDSALLAVQEEHLYPESNRECRVRLLRVSDGAEFWSRRQDDEKEGGWFGPLGFAAGDGDNLVLAHYPKDARVLDTGTGKELCRFASHSFHAVPSPDGKLLATDDHGEIVFIDLATGRETKRILVDPEEKARKGERGMANFAWDGEGRSLATTLPMAHVSILDPMTGKERKRFRVYTDDLPEVVKPHIKGLLRSGHGVASLKLSRDGKRLVASAINGWYVAVWDAETGKEIARLDHDFQVGFVAFTPDGKGVVTFGSTGLGYRWDIEKLVAAKK